MKTTTKRTIGTTMLILMFVVLYATLFVSACGVLVERGWEFWDASRALASLFVGFPSVIGYVLLASHLYFSGVEDDPCPENITDDYLEDLI
jgi:hypothetical protein